MTSAGPAPIHRSSGRRRRGLVRGPRRRKIPASAGPPSGVLPAPVGVIFPRLAEITRLTDATVG